MSSGNREDESDIWRFRTLEFIGYPLSKLHNLNSKIKLSTNVSSLIFTLSPPLYVLFDNLLFHLDAFLLFKVIKLAH